MMRFKLYRSLKVSFQPHFLASWAEILKIQSHNVFLNTEIISTSLPSQLTLHHEPLKKKLKPGIDHDYLLLWCVHYLTKVDWSLTDGFDHVPLFPSNNNFQALEDLISHRKVCGPLLHFLGLLPYVSKSRTQKNCPLQQKYREYPPASWPHALMCQ